MHTFMKLAVATVLGSAVSIAAAQAPGSESKMTGDMGDHPHQQATPGSRGPMSKERDDPKMRGEMGDHPHQQATAAQAAASGRSSRVPTPRPSARVSWPQRPADALPRTRAAKPRPRRGRRRRCRP